MKQPRPICLLNEHCYFQKNNNRTKFKRCRWPDTCNQQGPQHSKDETLPELRKKEFDRKGLRIWLP